MDCATRKVLCILGINVQISEVDSVKPIIRTLAIIQLTEQHTAKYLKEKIIILIIVIYLIEFISK